MEARRGIRGVVAALLLAASPVLADEPSGLAARSTSGVSVSATLDGAVMLLGGELGDAGASVRLHLSGFLVALGLFVWPPLIRNRPSAVLTIEPRLGLGYRFALARRVALSPTVRGGLLYILPLGQLVGLVVGIELPVTVFLSRSFFLEPFAFGGAYFGYAVALPVVSVGLRAGFQF
jgi:hypothetical protein